MSDEKPPDTGKIVWPEPATYGPFRYAVVGDQFIEFKDGKWVDEKGQDVTLTLSPPKKAAGKNWKKR